jgi:CRISPR-associated exonuclease Cas4
MYPEDRLLPISALQHLLFCPRQAALIHVERLWAENRLTVEGRHLHHRAHEQRRGWRGGVWVERGLALRSFDLGLAGVADVVEFHPPAAAAAATPLAPGGPRPGSLDDWRVMAVEYKRGRPKRDDSDRVQLCAQAFCLEEMIGVDLTDGEIFYGKRRRRVSVAFDARLRDVTRDAARRLHAIIDAGSTPPARREPKCDACSLLPLCLPEASSRGRRTARLVDDSFRSVLSSLGPTTDVDET